jgi:hypothetical protein
MKDAVKQIIRKTSYTKLDLIDRFEEDDNVKMFIIPQRWRINQFLKMNNLMKMRITISFKQSFYFGHIKAFYSLTLTR